MERALLLVLTGITAGLCATVAGLASLVSYPVLLAFGLPPVTANVTNTVSLVATGAGSVLGSRRELAGQRRRAVRFGVASAIGAAGGAVLLLTTPPTAFRTVVPFLVAGASVTVLVTPLVSGRLQARAARRAAAVSGTRGAGAERDSRPAELRPAEFRPPVLLAVGAVALYSGYFGAAGGVLTLALLSAFIPEGLPRVNALKNAVSIAANGTAAIAFALFGPVDWPVAAPLALGFFIGGRLGPAVVRRVPAAGLRVVIAILGLGLAVHLWWAAGARSGAFYPLGG